jgi:GDP-L-fucose synthase
MTIIILTHVLPALIRKMHLGKCLENNEWEAIRKDFKKYPIEGVDNTSSESEILDKLAKYGVNISQNTSRLTPHASRLVTITLWGTGSPYREFLYVDDLAEACVYVMQNIDFKNLSVHGKQVRNTHMNIGTGKDLTIKELAGLIKNVTGFSGEFQWDSSKPDGTFRKLLDVSKINRLGWKEKISLEEGIKLVYDKYSS